MTTTYNNPAFSEKDEVRFLLQDVGPTWLLQDEEIQYAIDKWTPIYDSPYYVASSPPVTPGRLATQLMVSRSTWLRLLTNTVRSLPPCASRTENLSSGDFLMWAASPPARDYCLAPRASTSAPVCTTTRRLESRTTVAGIRCTTRMTLAITRWSDHGRSDLSSRA
jgi:hypothetical protein